MNEQELIQLISTDLAIELPVDAPRNEWVEKLSMYINELITTDFQKLIFILYKIDVSEAKLKQLLQEYPTENAGKLIAELIIDRQQEKLKTRKNSNQMNIFQMKKSGDYFLSSQYEYC